jgi:hypothetical protein
MVRAGVASPSCRLDACFFHRAFCAATIRARPLADSFLRVVAVPFRYTPANAIRAAFSADNLRCTWSRSLDSCFTSPDKLDMDSPRFWILGKLAQSIAKR